MVRILSREIIEHDSEDGFIEYIEAAGLSTDSKPTDNVATGSIYIAVDTGKVYMFNEAASAWVEHQ